ncbi:RNA methyltransferase [Egbenema bharatensis]|uniref:RNA methyltransferase n=1 Tax=Egbenema bharatensis TaxID=3463334 RepID=UPI003A890B5E
MSLATVRIVLVEPAGALNLGSIARVMKNMGLRQLVLVNPQCDRFSDEARRMAVHATDVLESAQEVPTLLDALHHCHRVIATTGRDHTTLDVTLEPPRSALPWLLEPVEPLNLSDPVERIDRSDPAIHSALVFGREDRGLSNEELNYAQRHIFIPTSPVYPSMNLAQAVAICCYELHGMELGRREERGERREEGEGRREEGGERREESGVGSQESGVGSQESGELLSTHPPTHSPIHPPADLAPLHTLEGFYQHLETVLLKIGYLYPHTAASRMETFRRLFNRAYLSGREVSMLRGILRQVEWAVRGAEGVKEGSKGARRSNSQDSDV